MEIPCVCGASLRVKDEMAGKKVRCPKCSAVVAIPEKAQALEDDLVVEQAADHGPSPARRPKKKPKKSVSMKDATSVGVPLLIGGVAIVFFLAASIGVGMFWMHAKANRMARLAERDGTGFLDIDGGDPADFPPEKGHSWDLSRGVGEDWVLAAVTDPWPPKANTSVKLKLRAELSDFEQKFKGKLWYRIAKSKHDKGEWKPVPKVHEHDGDVFFEASITLPAGTVYIHVKAEEGRNTIELTDWKLVVS